MPAVLPVSHTAAGLGPGRAAFRAALFVFVISCFMINTNLKFWRRELSITQVQLADKLGIKRSLVAAFLVGTDQ